MWIRLIFQTYLASKPEGYPETGEGLFACSFEHENLILSIGTEDEDYLSQRAASNKWMPSRFEDLNANALNFIPGGVEVVLPSLNSGESIQLQFVVAWCLNESNGMASWFAVDQSADYILKSLSF